jgi:hypothetical protein
MTEREYRALPKDSASSIKDFAKDRKYYYRRHILGEDYRDDEDEDRATLMGSLVDAMELAPDEFDNKFHVSSTIDIPTGLMLQFVEALYRRTREFCNAQGELTKVFGEIALMAYNDVRFDKEGNVVAFKRDTFEKVLEKFDGPARQYYDEICKVRPSRLMVITLKDIEIAEAIRNTLRHNQFFKNVMQRKNTTDVRIVDQLMVEFDYHGVELKGMMDRIIIEEKNKTVYLYDLKVTWNVESFYYGFYLKRFAYIQAYLYTYALSVAFPGYDIVPMCFIVSDVNNYLHPLMYQLTPEDLIKARKGWEENGRVYKGVDQLIEELKWHKDAGIWNISKENYEHGAVCSLK